MKNKYFVSLLSLFVIACAAFLLPDTASAANGDFVITVNSELGYPIPSAGVSFSCGGSTFGTTTSAVGTVTIATSTLNAGGAYAAASCGGTNGKTIVFTATTTGYVSTTTTSGDTNFVTSVSNTFTIGQIPYTLKVTAMKREFDATSIMPTSVIGRPFSVVGSLVLASSSYSGGAWYLAASSTADTGTTLTATSTGYINTSVSNATTSTSAQRTVAFDGGSSASYNGDAFKFGLKVVVADQFGTAVVPQSASYLSSATTTSSGATLYFANTSATAGVLNIVAPGYINATTTNTGFGRLSVGTTTQVVMTLGAYSATTTPVTSSDTVKGLEPMLKISSFLDELGNSIMPTSGSPFTVSGALDLIAQTYSSGVWYVAASSTDTTGGTLTASVNGYVTKSVSSVLTSTTTQYTFNVGSSNGSTYNIVGLPFALKTTVQTSGGSAISGATVKAGNLESVTCSESGSTGIYYCVIPATDIATNVRVSKVGYNISSNSYRARSANSDGQSTALVVMDTASSVGASSSGSSSGGGGNYYYIAPVVTPAVTPTAQPNVILNSPIRSVFTARMVQGSSSNDVSRLQAILSTDKEIYPEGLVTGYFGKLTLKAVQKFQVKYGVAKPGDVGYGTVGPLTRAMLQKVFAQ